jgi:hypothetical protein
MFFVSKKCRFCSVFWLQYLLNYNIDPRFQIRESSLFEQDKGSTECNEVTNAQSTQSDYQNLSEELSCFLLSSATVLPHLQRHAEAKGRFTMNEMDNSNKKLCIRTFCKLFILFGDLEFSILFTCCMKATEGSFLKLA